MKHYYKIGEIAKLYNIGTDAIRYYERLGILTPKRAENGYRLYRIHDIWRLNVIRDLRELGFGMAQIGKYLENRSIDSTITLLEEERLAIRKKIQELEAQQANVSQRLETIREAKIQQTGIVTQAWFPERNCHRIPQGYRMDEEMDVIIKRLINFDQERLYVVGNNQIGSTIDLAAAQQGACREYTSVFIIDEKGKARIPAGDYLTLSYRGNCAQNYDYIPKMLDYASAQGRRPAGDILELLWVDIHASAKVEEHITQLQLRIAGEGE